MDLIQTIQYIGNLVLKFVNSINFITFLLLLIISYHFLLLVLRDKQYIDNLNKYKNPENVSISSLKELPLVNIVIPAWKEGAAFKKCLTLINQLSYPKLKVITNAGGSKETISIANSFKNKENFIVIYQKAGEGKLKAINDCLDYIFEGIIFLIDADLYLSDEIIIKMMNPIINQDEQVVISSIKPSHSIINIDIVKYLYINRNIEFRQKFSRYICGVGSNVCIKYEALRKIGKFTEKRFSDDGLSIGMDLSSKGIKSYILVNNKIPADTYPTKIIGYLNQNIRWLENALFTSIKNKKFRIIQFLGLVIISFCFLIFPFVLFFNIYFFLIGLIFLLSIYLKRVRKIVFYKLTNKNESIKLGFLFFLNLIFYIYLDLIINIIVFFEMLFFRKGYKKRKNLLS